MHTQHIKSARTRRSMAVVSVFLFGHCATRIDAGQARGAGRGVARNRKYESGNSSPGDSGGSLGDLLQSMSDGFLQFDGNSDDEFLFYSSEEADKKEGSYEDIYSEESDQHEEKNDRGQREHRRNVAGSNRLPEQQSALNTKPAKGRTILPSPVAEKEPMVASTKPSLSRKKEGKAKDAASRASQSMAEAKKSTSLSGMTPWVRRYLSTRPGLLVIPRDFLTDNFNLVQLPPVLESWAQMSPQARGVQFPAGWLYKQALERILAQNTEDIAESTAGVADDIVDWAASLLYQLVHQRYALSPRGLESLRRRFIVWQYQLLKKNPSLSPPYGRCPRVTCRGFPLVPYGPDVPIDENDNKADLRPWRYCGMCRETWRTMSRIPGSTEGCAWGQTVGPLFQLSYPQFLQGTETAGTDIPSTLEPRIFGFRLHPGAVGVIYNV